MELASCASCNTESWLKIYCTCIKYARFILILMQEKRAREALAAEKEIAIAAMQQAQLLAHSSHAKQQLLNTVAQVNP